MEQDSPEGGLVRQSKRKISIEFEEILVIRRPESPVHLWCGSCGERVLMLAANQAARIARISDRTIFRWVESGRLHFVEVPGGSLLICRMSLRAAVADLKHAAHADDVSDSSPAIDVYQAIEGEL